MNKKKYSKPEIFFEDFSLSTNIAAGCEYQPLNNAGDCGVQWGRHTIFLEGMSGCKKYVIDGDANNDGLCYHNPTDNNVFNS